MIENIRESSSPSLFREYLAGLENGKKFGMHEPAALGNRH
jgi:hypothetical protein